MDTIDFFVESLQRNQEMLKSTIADFSDADMLVRPVAAANHAAWQLGHLIKSETNSLNSMKPGAAAELPAGFADKFTKETASLDDPASFPKKAELLDAFAKARAATIAWAKSLSPADLDQPTPERMRRFAATAGHLLGMMPLHVMMHVGQFQVIRRKLGKPVLM